LRRLPLGNGTDARPVSALNSALGDDMYSLIWMIVGAVLLCCCFVLMFLFLLAKRRKEKLEEEELNSLNKGRPASDTITNLPGQAPTIAGFSRNSQDMLGGARARLQGLTGSSKNRAPVGPTYNIGADVSVQPGRSQSRLSSLPGASGRMSAQQGSLSAVGGSSKRMVPGGDSLGGANPNLQAGEPRSCVTNRL